MTDAFTLDGTGYAQTGSGSGLWTGDSATTAANNSGGALATVNDWYSSLAKIYVTTKGIENANKAAYSAYAYNTLTGQSNGATMAPYSEVVAQQQKVASAQKAGISSQMILFAGLALVAVLILKK